MAEPHGVSNRWGDLAAISDNDIFEHAKKCLADPEFPADLRPELQRIIDEEDAECAQWAALAALLDEDQ